MPTMKLMLAALVATSVIAIVAAVFAIWPVVADAPWESDDPSFSRVEVISLVKAGTNPSSCPSRAWKAEYRGDHIWYVGTQCGFTSPSLNPASTTSAVWSFREQGERIIPLNNFATRFMR